jgi:hypothetical protein
MISAASEEAPEQNRAYSMTGRAALALLEELATSATIASHD